MAEIVRIRRWIVSLTILIAFVEAIPRRPTDCLERVATDEATYVGCKELLRTDSLTKPKTSKKAIYSFKGIPFAEPPLGYLRFRKPVAKVWPKKRAIWDARHYRKPCMQPWLADYPFLVMSEDCLHLNVFTPTLDTNANLPVMVWIYGGAFTIGSSGQFAGIYLTNRPIFEGSELALRDVVVVTINYRLGVFGFLYANSSDSPGNQGLWDQALALHWVRDNIRSFGGDPNQMTLFGESAGSISISNHIVSNYTRNLFQKAILQSGTAYIKLMSRDMDYAYDVARVFATNKEIFRSGDCGHTDGWVDCLREKSASELLGATIASIFRNSHKPWYTVWIQQFGPIFGDEFVPININKAVKEGNFNKKIKILMGHNEMEGMFFTIGFDVILGLNGRYNPFMPYAPVISRDIVFDDLRRHFFDNDTIGIAIAKEFTRGFHKDIRKLDRNGIRRAAVHAFGDYFLTCPTILFGAHMVQNRDFMGEVYQYRLTYAHKQSFARQSVWADVTHTDEIALVFGSPWRDPHFWSDADRRLSKEIMHIWTHFAIYGSMKRVNGNEWPKYGLRTDYNSYSAVNASYIELHASSDRLGRVWTDRYTEDPTRNPKVINDCFYHWDEVISGQFESPDLSANARKHTPNEMRDKHVKHERH